MQAADLQHAQAVTLTELLNSHTVEGKKPEQILDSKETRAVTKYLTEEPNTENLRLYGGTETISWSNGFEYKISTCLGIL